MMLETLLASAIGIAMPPALPAPEPTLVTIDDKKRPPARPPVRPPTKRPESGLQKIRRKLADKTIGKGRAVDRSRDRRYRGQNEVSNGKKDKEQDQGGQAKKRDSMSKELREANDRVRKKIDEQKRRAKASLALLKDKASPEGRVYEYRMKYYDQLAAYLSKASSGGSSAGDHKSSKSKKDRPKRGSFEDRRDRFLKAEAKSFGSSARGSRDAEVKAMYERLRAFAETYER